MGFLKRLFGLEKKSSSVIVNEEVKQEATLEVSQEIAQPKIREYKEDICSLCNLPIGQERYKKIQDKFIHKKCFKAGEKLLLNGK